jgi:hypothetical protein
MALLFRVSIKGLLHSHPSVQNRTSEFVPHNNPQLKAFAMEAQAISQANRVMS